MKPDDVYGVLRGALMQMPEDAPFRGPKEYVDKGKNLKYTNSWEGNVERYSGAEKITKEDGTVVYEAFYRGGLVDQQTSV
jgi:hypothetical protein